MRTIYPRITLLFLIIMQTALANTAHRWIISTPWSGKAQAQWVPAQDASVRWVGRVAFADSVAEFDWPGIYWEQVVETARWSVVLSGENLFDVWVNDAHAGVIRGTAEPQRFSLQWARAEKRSIRVGKRTESQVHSSKVLGFDLPHNAKTLAPPPAKERRLEFIGDSYTAGYGNECGVQEPPPGTEDSLLLHTTNANKSFGALVAQRLGADYQINGFSGRGLVRNFNGINPGLEYPHFYQYTLVSQAQNLSNITAPPWDFATWHPQVIVLGLGINDFQGAGPYADSAKWVQAYGDFLQQLRQAHPGVQMIVCATQIHPNNDLIPKAKQVVFREQQKGNLDVHYFEYTATKTGLWWHPSIYDHQEIAQKLIPLVMRAGKWLRR
ncbi:MAG: SGNH/GDSL hydrolase family protein [Fibrobacter sp.]|nr:SGNH/GDSL hydrolase family protein [Fibrobacter sp.]